MVAGPKLMLYIASTGTADLMVTVGGAKMTSGQLSTAQDVLRAMSAGRATLTLVSRKTGNRFTYKFTRPKGDDPNRCIWVKVLTGADNESSYWYLGVIWPKDMKFVAKGNGTMPSAVAMRWAVDMLREFPEDLLVKAEVWHEGTCCRCGRKLTVPSSIASGIGPECSKYS